MNFEIIPYGEDVILINFDQQIDPKINAFIHALGNEVRSQNWYKYIIPAYCSLTIGLKNSHSFRDAVDWLEKNIPHLEYNPTDFNKWTIPVCYDTEYGIDLKELSSFLDVPISSIVEMHSKEDYQVFMIGFLPGFPYMGKIDSMLEVERKKTPRKIVKRGSVGIAGLQTGIYPTDSPGGWQIIGRTPIDLVRWDGSPKTLLSPGDRVMFNPIEREEFDSIARDVKNGNYNWEILRYG